MKTRISAFIIALIFIASFAGCGFGSSDGAIFVKNVSSQQLSSEQSPSGETEKPAEPVDVNVVALKGPTAIGMIKFMDDANNGLVSSNNYSFSIVGSADEVTPKIIKGEVDIAALPVNLASVLYNNTKGEINVLAVNTLGVLYIVESGETVKSVEDLRGKTIYASGKGAVPEYSLNHILSSNGIDPENDVTIEWKSEHAECLAALMANENSIAMLPQPFVTTAQLKSDNIRVALDLTDEWNKLTANNDGSMLITGVVAARKDFIESNPQAVADFLDNYGKSVDFVNGNIDDAAVLVGKYDIVPEQVAKKAIPHCNITFIDGKKMQKGLSGYLEVLFEQNPKSVGGAMPNDDFYFVG